MGNPPDVSPTLLRCPQCGKPYSAESGHCPECGPVRRTPPPRTRPLTQEPTVMPHWGQRRSELGPERRVILQSLPSAICFPVNAAAPIILGRGAPSDGRAVLDLSPTKAYEHGVSRFHCLLQPQGANLFAMDLSSRNGTYLNDNVMQPMQQYALAHGDKLILGTLHLLVFFD